MWATEFALSSLHEMCDESGYVHEDQASAVVVQHKSGKSIAGTQSHSGILTNTLCLYNTVSAVWNIIKDIGDIYAAQ